MIEISHLGKKFGNVDAVVNLNLNLVPGEILGFLGPNGAGKSTTMKMLTGFMNPSSGHVKIFGHDVMSDRLEAQKLIGYLPEGAPAYEEMTTQSYLGFIAEVRGFTGLEKKKRVEEVIIKMSLHKVVHQKIETLSKGFKRRVGLAQAIIHDPKVLILDEPTDGLDPNQKHQVRSLIKSLSKEKIVVISTHILEEVTAVCNRVIIISEGKLLSDCSPHELEKKSAFYGAVSIEFHADVDLNAVSDALISLSEVDKVQVNDGLLTVYPIGTAELYTVLDNFFHQNETFESKKPTAMYLEKGKLDDVFRQITQGDAA